MALLTGLEQLLGLKKKQARSIPQNNARGATPPPGMVHNTTPMPLVVAHPTAQAQGYPGSPDDADQFGATGVNPQPSAAPQLVVQPTIRPFQLQADRPGDTMQYGTNPQLVDLRRRILGF